MYISPEEYSDITFRYRLEATEERIKRACLLLDARIGNHSVGRDGWKLDMDRLPEYRKNAVKEWVAQMVSFLYDNGDVSPSAASISLGRFSVTEHGQKGQLIPERMGLADAVLASSGIVIRGVKTK
ncbi:MAG: hypothetical protein WC260_03830 [Candidatus Pacearchaeota archaeon]